MKKKYLKPRARQIQLDTQSFLAASGNTPGPKGVSAILHVKNVVGGFNSAPGPETAKKAILW